MVVEREDDLRARSGVHQIAFESGRNVAVRLACPVQQKGIPVDTDVDDVLVDQLPIGNGEANDVVLAPAHEAAVALPI